MTQKLQAAQRLLAVSADEKQAKVFLESLGFVGLVPKLSSDDRISFRYSTFDRPFLEKHYGDAKKMGPTQVGWKFGLDGYIVLKENSKIVVLQNSKRNSKKLSPIETHVPEGTPGAKPVVIPKPVPKDRPTFPKPLPTPGYDDPEDTPPKPVPPSESPNVPGSKDNDDKKVPTTQLSPELEKMYKYCQSIDDTTYRLNFNKKLWAYLNAHKFGGRMTQPHLGLMKKVAALKMRVRGRWWPSKRLLEVSPRLYNASQNFFVEIFLHEMCHEAVSELDKVFSREEAGHGSHWKAWMLKVGLNPLRFDPNDNTTYMSKRELEEHERKVEEVKEKKEQVKQHISESGMVRMIYIRTPTIATVNWNHKLYHGMIACATAMNNQRFAFIDCNNINSEKHLLVPPEDIYIFNGTDEQKERSISPAMMNRVQRIRDYYEFKMNKRAVRRFRY